MITTQSPFNRTEERQLAREALAKLLAKSLFEEWLNQNAHLIPGDARAKPAADAERVLLP